MRLVVGAFLAACGATTPPTAPANLALDGGACDGTFTWLDSDGEDDYVLVHHVAAYIRPLPPDHVVTIGDDKTRFVYATPTTDGWSQACSGGQATMTHTYVLHARNDAGEAESNVVTRIVPGWGQGP